MNNNPAVINQIYVIAIFAGLCISGNADGIAINNALNLISLRILTDKHLRRHENNCLNQYF